ncbi:MAG: hypothetical protein HWE22_07860 [Flavobacteriales bacterium]|nr:hypothetical protein [Flavobacteriales bacterium]
MELVNIILGSIAGSSVTGIIVVQVRKALDKYQDYRMTKLQCETDVKINRDNNRHAAKLGKEYTAKNSKSQTMTRAS